MVVTAFIFWVKWPIHGLTLKVIWNQYILSASSTSVCSSAQSVSSFCFSPPHSCTLFPTYLLLSPCKSSLSTCLYTYSHSYLNTQLLPGHTFIQPHKGTTVSHKFHSDFWKGGRTWNRITKCRFLQEICILISKTQTKKEKLSVKIP